MMHWIRENKCIVVLNSISHMKHNNLAKEFLYLMHCDMNNLHGQAMKQMLPKDDF